MLSPVFITGCWQFTELMEDAERAVGEPGRDMKTVADRREIARSLVTRALAMDGELNGSRRVPSVAGPRTALRP